MKKLLSLFGTVALLSACTFTVSTDMDKNDQEEDSVPAEENVEMGMPAEDNDDADEMVVEEEKMDDEEMEDQEPTEEEGSMDEKSPVEDGGDGNTADGAGTTVEVNVEAGASDSSSSDAAAE